MKEEFDENFIRSRFGNDKGKSENSYPFLKNIVGNLYSMSHYLYYYGEDPKVYQSQTKDTMGAPLKVYKQEFGNGKWNDLIAFAKVLCERKFVTRLKNYAVYKYYN